MAHPVPLGAQVGDVVSGHRSGGADPPDEVKVVAGQPAVLVWVVGDQPQPADTEAGEDRRADAVVAGVDRQPERGVGVDRVVAALLQRVRPQLVAQPDPAAFVPRVGTR